MATSTSSAETGLKEQFFRHFQDTVQSLQEQIDSLKNKSASGSECNEIVDNCLVGIDRLSHEVKDASTYVPAYDQRTYSQTIKALSESLQAARSSFNPPRRFTFKARKAATTTKDPEASILAQPGSSLSKVSSDTTSETSSAMFTEQQQTTLTDSTDPQTYASIVHSTGIRRPSFSHTTQIALSHFSDLHIVLPSSASHATAAGTLSHLSHCIIDLSAATASNTPFAALYLKDIQDSLIICGQVAGAIHITDIKHSVLVTACRQFRMHGSMDVDIYLHTSSRPIFEDCSELRFAPLPNAFITDAISQLPNQWDQIDDFKWLKVGPSPNFSIIAEEKRIGCDVWRKVIAAEEEDLNDLLGMIRNLLQD
ncbi:hypothetical protein IAQ61_010162 [Plenodomus lingam]|uniref:Similar to tubulin-specific chaperone c n=1 Tax=Leptosphaeria maculans (strain JN3 / isolate v23.1.3 / race Av1-4-5-6-7-8) TaxID=985895 RepID=E5A345_LEPMJ|nr:similar to tubulin-specific chaperone c [Plenodomus lingam JN3]KAH9861961.1 hypothetical protein IAQ61_010162 [Plenodomus lingam]CBX98058.1 similar to tubulin-specific chaperone c [Plenodomus lingam JN3]